MTIEEIVLRYQEEPTDQKNVKLLYDQAKKWARKHRYKYRNRENVDDIEQECIIQVFRCAKKFDVSKGLKFVSYVYATLPYTVQKRVYQDFNTIAVFKSHNKNLLPAYLALSKEPLDSEIRQIAKQHKVKASDLRDIIRAIGGQACINIPTSAQGEKGTLENILEGKDIEGDVELCVDYIRAIERMDPIYLEGYRAANEADTLNKSRGDRLTDYGAFVYYVYKGVGKKWRWRADKITPIDKRQVEVQKPRVQKRKAK